MIANRREKKMKLKIKKTLNNEFSIVDVENNNLTVDESLDMDMILISITLLEMDGQVSDIGKIILDHLDNESLKQLIIFYARNKNDNLK